VLIPHIESSAEEDAILEIRPEEESNSEVTNEFQNFILKTKHGGALVHSHV
jgi:hypothetical protein